MTCIRGHHRDRIFSFSYLRMRLTEEVQDELPWSITVATDIMLIDEITISWSYGDKFESKDGDKFESKD